MKYAPLAHKGPISGISPDAEEIRAFTKTWILERLACGDLDEIEAEELIAELGLRSA